MTRITLCFLAVLLAGTTYSDAAVRLKLKMTVYDAVSNSTQKMTGYMHLGSLSEASSSYRITTAGGKTLCQGTRSGGDFTGSFGGTCLGIPARGTLSRAANKVFGAWNYKGSWQKFEAPYYYD